MATTIDNYQEARVVLIDSLKEDIPARIQAIRAALYLLVPGIGDSVSTEVFSVVHNEKDEVIIRRLASNRTLAIYTNFSKDSDKMDILVEVEKDGKLVREDISNRSVNETVFALIGLLGMDIQVNNHYNDEYHQTMQAMVEAEGEEQVKEIFEEDN